MRHFRPGDEVYAEVDRGSFAEYTCVSEDLLCLKPVNLTFEQAAAVPLAAGAALQGLRDTGKVHPGQKVLINGGSGGVGTFAVQIAASFGAEVTGVCSTRNVDMVRSIGAATVVDYTREDFTRGDPRFDLMLDNVGTVPSRSADGCCGPRVSTSHPSEGRRTGGSEPWRSCSGCACRRRS